MPNNVTCRFNGKPMGGMAAVFPIDGEDWVTIVCDVEAEPNVSTSMSIRVKDLCRLLKVPGVAQRNTPTPQEGEEK